MTEEINEELQLLSQVKGYLAIHLKKILENEDVYGLISSLLKDNINEISELKNQVKVLKKEIDELKTKVTMPNSSPWATYIDEEGNCSGGGTYDCNNPEIYIN